MGRYSLEYTTVAIEHPLYKPASQTVACRYMELLDARTNDLGKDCDGKYGRWERLVLFVQ